MTPYTASELRAEIARLTRQRDEWNILGLSDWDSDAEIAAEIKDLENEIEMLTEDDSVVSETKEAA